MHFSPMKVETRDYRNCDPAAFKESLSNSNWNEVTFVNGSLNDSWNSFEVHLIDTINTHAPLMERTVYGK